MPKILVIDDSNLMRKISRAALEEAGFDVEDFLPESVLQLMERVQQSSPDLVLSDYNMPNVDGQNVARTVRRVDPNIPVVILTANRDAAREAVLRTMGVRRILHKPIQGAELAAAVQEVLTMAEGD